MILRVHYLFTKLISNYILIFFDELHTCANTISILKTPWKTNMTMEKRVIFHLLSMFFMLVVVPTSKCRRDGRHVDKGAELASPRSSHFKRGWVNSSPVKNKHQRNTSSNYNNITGGGGWNVFFVSFVHLKNLN